MNALIPQNMNALMADPRLQELIQTYRMAQPQEHPLMAYGRMAQQNWNSRPQGWGIRPAPMAAGRLANKRSNPSDFGFHG